MQEIGGYQLPLAHRLQEGMGAVRVWATTLWHQMSGASWNPRMYGSVSGAWKEDLVSILEIRKPIKGRKAKDREKNAHRNKKTHTQRETERERWKKREW